MASDFDLIVIGGGPAGYTAAIRASQLGFKTACVEKDKTLGGTCLNVGCIPSKAMLESSEHYHQAKHKFAKHGIVVGDLKLDLASMHKRREGIVRQLTNGIAGLFKKHKIEWIKGLGTIQGGNASEGFTVAVKGEADTTIVGKRVLICTGSAVAQLPFLPVDEKRVLSSTGALEIPEVPKHLVVIGGGVIGLELGSVWSRLGARVTVIEFQDHILGATDRQTSNELQKSLVKQGLEFKLAHKCLGAEQNKNGLLIQVEEMATGTKSQIECDYVLVSTGRKPYTQGLGLEKLGIELDKIGRIPVDLHNYQTKVAGIFAVGDVIEGPMLAHKAEEEAVAAVELMAGVPGHCNYATIPNVVYTWPEIATVGATEEELKAQGIEYKSGSFPFMANARAKTMEDTEGFVKVLAHAKTDRVLGVHIVGPRASDMIAEAVTAMEYGGSSEDIARTCHAHPTLSEVLKEAALAVDKRQLNL